MPFRILLSFLWVLLSAGAWAQPGSGGPTPETPSVSVLSITRINSVTTNTTSVSYLVTFNSNVTGLSPNNFALNVGSGLSGASVSTVTGSGSSYTVAVGTGSGSGSLQLVLQNSTGINPLASNVPFSGETYQIDKTQPSVSISSSAGSSGDNTTTSPIPVTVTFSESVTGFVAGDVTVNNGTITGNTVTSSGTTYTFTVTPTANGVVTVNIDANVAQDAAGNGNAAATPFTLQYDPIPSIAGFAAQTSAVCVGSPLAFTATIGNVTGSYAYTLTNGSSTTTGTSANALLTQQLTPSGSGVQSFTLTVSTATQSATATASVMVNGLPVAGLTNNGPLSCTLTSVTLGASGGSSYTFVNGSGSVLGTPGSASTLVVNAPGSYSVLVANSAGCTSVASTMVGSDLTTPTAGLTNDGPLTCSKTSVVLTASGVGTYQFSTGTTPINGGPTATVTTAGVYSVTVIGTNGCSSIASTTVVGNQSVPVAGLTNDGPLSCTKTSVLLTASGSGSYRFSTGATQVNGGNTAIVSTAGIYSVTVTAANGCTATTSTQVTGDQSVPTASLTNDGPLNCLKTSVTLTAAGGGTYRFSSEATQLDGGNTATVSTAGIYSVTVTSANSCSAVTSTTVTGDQLAPTAGLINSGPLSCLNTSVTLTASGTGTYRFSNGATQVSNGNTATVSAAGIYSVTLTSANGCTATASTTVTEDQLVPTVSLANDGPLSCTKTSVTLTATGIGTYQFSAGAVQLNNGPTATVTSVGLYSVTVTAANGCTATASTTVAADQTIPNSSLANDGPLSCTKPSVTLTATGSSAMLTYQFGAGAMQIGSGNTATVSAAGIYSVTVTAGNGCSAVASTTVTGDQLAPTADLTNDGPLSCTKTSVILTASGAGSYQFSAGATQVNGGNTATVTVAGVYSVIVTGANGCTATASTNVIDDLTAPIANLINDGPLSCAKTSVILTATGTGTYRFSNGATQVSNGPTATVTTTGIYSVTVTGTNGCTATASTTVTGDQLAPTVALTNNGPLNCTKTSVTLTASGGGTYRFSMGATQVGSGNTATVTTAGVYSVTVLAANGCSAVASTTVVADLTIPTASLANDGPLSCSKSSVTLTATGEGTYRFSTGATQFGNGNTATVTTMGIYSVTVTAANGCSTVAQTNVDSDLTLPVANLANNGPLTCTKTSVTLTATGTGTYQFSSGATQINGGNTATVTTAGIYSVTVTSTNGCSTTASTTVTVDQTAPTASLTNDGPLSCLKTSVTLIAAGGGAYRFSTGATPISGGNTATVTMAGIYSVTVIGTNGCTATTSTTVTSDQLAPTAGLTNDGPLSCLKTSVTLTATGGGTYRFSTGATQINGGNTATVTTAGTYSVTVISANGCSAMASTTVTSDQSAPSVNLSNDGPLSCTRPSVILTASGTGTYRFSGGATQIGNGNTATVTTAGIYSVTVTGANGCTATASTQVIGDQLTPTAGLTNDGPLSCAKTSVILTASGAGTYRFSTGATQVGNGPTATVSTAGIYSVTVIGTNGCSAVASTTVTGDQTLPTVSLANDGPLSCVKTTVTLTAMGTGSYRFSPGATQIGNGNTATVNTAGIYSVTVTGANGCSAVASTTVTGDLTVPTASLANDGPLSCTKPSVTLTAIGVGTYRFSNGATQVNGGNTATVSAAGIYSVTVTAANGCFAVASTTVTGEQTAPTVNLTSDGPLACTGGIVTLTAAATPGSTYRFSQGATQINGGNTATITVAGIYSVTATAPNGCVGVASTTITATSCSFAITGVTTVSCTPINGVVGQRAITFTPQYTGLTGQPISFSVANEMPATQAASPYTLRLYMDNPVITLVAQQGGVTTTFSYDWLSACSGPVTPPINTPPTLVSVIPAQIATVGQTFAFVIPAGTFTDAQTPNQLTLSVSGLPAGLVFTQPATISGTPSVSGISTVAVTATDPGGLSVSTNFILTVQPGTVVTPPTGFAISGVTTIACAPVNGVAGQREVTFTPQYTGLTGQPISFSVANEMAATQAAGPYTLRLYMDNPVITLVAQQGGVTTTFSYDWLSACSGPVTPPVNTPPTLVNAIPAQTATVGQAFAFGIPAGTFTDTQTPTQLVLTVSGLPAGLVFTAPATISGVSTTTGVSTVQVTATDPGGLSASTSFQLTVQSGTVVTPPTGFAISGVTTIACAPVNGVAGQREVTFTPQYTGLTGQPISFSVANEMAPTQAAGPYTLRLYTDNPVITLVAQQGGVTTTFSYNWLSACGSSQGRVGAVEENSLQVTVLGNPLVGDELILDVTGASGLPLTITTANERGYATTAPVHRPSAGVRERVELHLSGPAGVYVLTVSTPTGRVVTKVIKP